MKKDESTLESAVIRLSEVVEKQTQLKHKFLSGLVFGLGTALGASVFAGIIIYVLSQIFSAAGIVNMFTG